MIQNYKWHESDSWPINKRGWGVELETPDQEKNSASERLVIRAGLGMEIFGLLVRRTDHSAKIKFLLFLVSTSIGSAAKFHVFFLSFFLYAKRISFLYVVFSVIRKRVIDTWPGWR